MNRLATAAYTSSGACHNFHKVIVGFSPLNLIDQGSCISQSADCRRAHRHIIHLENSLLHSVMFIKTATSNSPKSICRRIFLLQQIVGSSQGRLHNTTGSSKDHTSSGAFLHRAITFPVYQGRRLNMSSPYHPQKFSGGYHRIHIVACIFLVVKFHFTLTLFCHTWHYGYGIDFLRIHPKFLGKISLHDCTKHLLWRFG